MINEELKTKAENTLKKYERIKMNKEDNVKGGMYVIFVGFAGTIAGITLQSRSHMMAGLVVQTGGLLFQMFNNNKLKMVIENEEKLRYALDSNEKFDVYEDEKGDIIASDNISDKSKGKHFKK